MKRPVFIAIATLVTVLSGSRASHSAEAQNLDAQQIVHLLDYVGSDYGGAVSDGRVVNDRELAEQLEVLAEAGRLAARLTAAKTGQAATTPVIAVLRVRRMVESHRSEADVTAAVKAAHAEIVAVFDLTQAPVDPPVHERGQQLFREHCVTCHGAEGRADTPRALQYTPHPANFHDPAVAQALSPLRVFTTVRFGVPNTAMVPFDFLTDADRWNLAFYVSELDHVVTPTRVSEARIFSLAELASESDSELRDDLRGAGIAENASEAALADLRVRAPYEADTQKPRGAASMVMRARAGLKKLGMQLLREDREGARQALLGIYLDDVEPIEAPLRAKDPALTRDIEASFKQIRSDIERGSSPADLEHKLDGLLAQMARAGRALESSDGSSSFVTTMLSSASIALREGVEAALLIAALLAVVGRAGASERKRWVHLGWMTALIAGALTWLASREIVAISGLGREMLEGVSALLAAGVLFYVSYWLFAKREAARWVTYLRSKAKRGEAALPLFGIAFLAVYREAFETVIFYQALVSQPGSGRAAATGVLLGAALLVGLVALYGRAGRFAPPQSFFAFSSVLLYALAVVFAGQGISALQTTGHLPLHPVKLPNLPALGVYPTIETYAVQIALVLLALGAALALKAQRPPPGPPGPRGDDIAGSREGAKL